MGRGALRAGLLALTAFACWPVNPARAADEPALRQRVEAFFDSLQAAVHAKDVDAAVAHFDPEVLVFHPGEEQTRGTEILRQGLEALFAGHSMRMSDELVDVQAMGDDVLAVGHYRHEIIPADGAAPAVRSGRFLVILRPGPDGGWRIWRDMDQAAPPGALAPRREGPAAP